MDLAKICQRLQQDVDTCSKASAGTLCNKGSARQGVYYSGAMACFAYHRIQLAATGMADLLRACKAHEACDTSVRLLRMM